jgi:hypothetical protein
MQWLSSDHLGISTDANATEEWCFLRSSCRVVLKRTSQEFVVSHQRDLNYHVKERVRVPKYTKWNPYHKIMADYSAMKSYMEKNNLNYFALSPNSEKPIKTRQRKIFTTALSAQASTSSSWGKWRPIEHRQRDKPTRSSSLYSLLP